MAQRRHARERGASVVRAHRLFLLYTPATYKHVQQQHDLSHHNHPEERCRGIVTLMLRVTACVQVYFRLFVIVFKQHPTLQIQ